MNIISKPILATLPVYYQTSFKCQNFKILCVNFFLAQVLGIISLPITIFGQKISTKFQGMERSHSNVYQSIRFLKQNSAIMSFGNSEKNFLSLLMVFLFWLIHIWNLQNIWKVLSLGISNFLCLRMLRCQRMLGSPCCSFGTLHYDPYTVATLGLKI